MGLASNVTGGLASGINMLNFDEQSKDARNSRKKVKATGAVSGITQAGTSFGSGLFSAVSGLVTQPVNAAKTEGAAGAATGFFKAIVSIPSKVVTGTLDAASSIIEGVGANVTNTGAIKPRLVLVSRRVVPQYPPNTGHHGHGHGHGSNSPPQYEFYVRAVSLDLQGVDGAESINTHLMDTVPTSPTSSSSLSSSISSSSLASRSMTSSTLTPTTSTSTVPTASSSSAPFSQGRVLPPSTSAPASTSSTSSIPSIPGLSRALANNNSPPTSSGSTRPLVSNLPNTTTTTGTLPHTVPRPSGQVNMPSSTRPPSQSSGQPSQGQGQSGSPTVRAPPSQSQSQSQARRSGDGDKKDKKDKKDKQDGGLFGFLSF